MLSEQETESQSKEQFAKIVREHLEQVISEAKNPKEKGDRFLIWAVTRLVDASEDEIKNQIVDGKNDMGIDAWIKPDIETENGGIIQLFQCKFNESHDDSKILQFQEDVKNFLKMRLEDIPRDDLKRLHQLIKTQNLEPELYYITDQTIEYKSDNPKLKTYGFSQIIDKLWLDIAGIPSGVSENIRLEKFFEYNQSIIGVLSLSELRKFIEKTNSYIFESNIRKYLQRTKINKGLKETLEKRASDAFYFNNGITIVVKDYQIGGDKITLSEPQIVNGAQTSQTIYERLPLITNVQGSIQVTIIKESNATTRREITKFRNSQNAVKGKDLISLEGFHRGIKAQLKEKGYFYQQQAGAWNFISEKQSNYKGNEIYKKYLTTDHENMVEASTAIQAMVAGIFQNPTKPYSSIASYMPNGSNYSKVFDSKLKEDFRLLFYPYLIKCYGEKLGYGIEEKPEQKRYARLLFVTAYFKILFDYILKKSPEDVRTNPEILEPIFMNFENNKKLLDLTNQAMDYYFHRAREYYDANEEVVTWHNFFSHHAWNDELQKAFKSFLKDKQEDLKEIRDNFYKS